jgi:hypothetical protein
MIFRENPSSPEVKNIQVDLITWFTITLSIQLITKDAVFVIKGTQPR